MISKDFMQKFLSRIDKIDKEQLQSFVLRLVEDMEILYRMWDGSFSGVVIFNEKKQVDYANNAALDILRANKKESILGKTVDDIIDTPDFRKYLNQKMEISGIINEEEHVLSTPFVRVIRASFYPVRNKNNMVKFFMLFFVDITRRKLEEIKNRRKESIASMVHLAAGIAHEIKNPLASIDIHLKLSKRYLSNAQEFKGKREVENVIDILEEEVNRLNLVVQDFLSSIRPISLVLKNESLEHLLKNLLRFLALEFNKHKIKTELFLEDNLPPVLGDNKYLRIVFLNLLKNAIEAFPDEQEERMISVKVYENAPYVEVIVKDNGKGISGDELEKIFEPYFTTKSYGTGIGLTMVHKIITEHDGNIKVESIEGKGTAFIVSLPQYKGQAKKFLEKKNDKKAEVKLKDSEEKLNPE